MLTYRTVGIILKTKDVGEKDRLFTIFSRNLGKRGLIARGIKKISSRRAGSIDLANVCNYLIVKGASRDLVSEVELLKSFPRAKSNLQKSAALFFMLELVERLTGEHQEAPTVYDLLDQSLAYLEAVPNQKIPLLLVAFEVKLLRGLGFFSAKNAQIPDSTGRSYLQFLEVASYDVILEKMGRKEVLRKAALLAKNELSNLLGEEFYSPKFLREVL